MSKLNNVMADTRTRTVLKVAGAILALMGLVLGGVASEPVIFPN